MSCAPQARTCRRIPVRCNCLLCAPATEPPQPRSLSAPDGLYSPTSAEQRGTEPTEADVLHGWPLRQRRNAADELHAGTLELQPMTSTAQDRAVVRATGVRAAVNEDSTERPEADATHTLHNAAALAARYQRAIPGVAPRERSVLAASEDACFSAPALFRIRPHNAAVQPPHAALSSAPQVRHFIMRLRRASHGGARPLNCGVMWPDPEQGWCTEASVFARR